MLHNVHVNVFKNHLVDLPYDKANRRIITLQMEVIGKHFKQRKIPIVVQISYDIIQFL